MSVRFLTLGVAVWLGATLVHDQARATSSACPRPLPGSAVAPPPDLYSSNGALNVALGYQTGIDPENRTTYCFTTTDGQQAPTLHVTPGDTLNVTLTNQEPASVPARTAPMHGMVMSDPGATTATQCGDSTQLPTSTNIHFHGMNVAPVCHGDEVIHTLVNPGTTFTYSLAIPKNEPPGLYWYHPHVHGISHVAVEGGASGAIIVDGIQNVVPAVAGLPERVLLVRSPVLSVAPGTGAPGLDLSLNYVPIDYPAETPAQLVVAPGRTEFWRVVNSASDTIINLSLNYDGVVQPLQVVALDGVALGSQDSTKLGHPVIRNHIQIMPAGRAEFIITTPAATVKSATLTTAAINTGPAGDVDTARTLAVISPTGTDAGLPVMPAATSGAAPQRFAGLAEAAVTAKRKLYFSEIVQGVGPGEGTFYITVDGAVPQVFDPSGPPAITTTQGAVEDWTIQNQSQEVHAFHIHQIHFLTLARNGVALPKSQQQMLDTVEVPYWSGKGPYPSVTVRMDFRGPVVGDFVYHCHILDHEDNGMMAIIRVQPKVASTK